MTDNEIFNAIEESIDRLKANGSSEEFVLTLSRGTVEDIIRIYNQQKAEIERLKANADMADGYADALEQRAKSEAIKDVILTLEAEVESNNKYLREYDNSEVQKAYNQGLKSAYNLVKEMVGDNNE